MGKGKEGSITYDKFLGLNYFILIFFCGYNLVLNFFLFFICFAHDAYAWVVKTKMNETI